MPEQTQSAKAIEPIRPVAEPNWRRELALAFHRIPDLLHALGLDSGASGVPGDVLQNFPLRVPRGFVARMRQGDWADPLLRQVLPVADEASPVPGFVADPVGDLNSSRGNGVLQKYHGRALLIVTGACAVHCRYCFRREYPYRAASATAGRLEAAIDTLRSDRSIHEVILSGGDPLSLSNQRLRTLLEGLNGITHLKRIRVHTRLPVVLPERIDSGLLDALSRSRVPVICVLHSNHANELDAGVESAIRRLTDSTRTLLNQAVLLRGVNDNRAALVALSERLFDVGVSPYYLHQLDRVHGAAHFQVADGRARRLLESTAAFLPGYLVPKLVRERPGATAKELLAPF